MTKSPVPKRKPRTPLGRRGSKPAGSDMNQATTDEFEREHLGIAPKE